MSISKTVMKALNQRPIAVYPIYIDIAGSMKTGVMLSQLMYWFSVKDKIYKTDKEFIEEIRISKKELEQAKKKIKTLPFINVTREGVPAKTYYEIDWVKYEEMVNLAYPKGGNKIPQKGETITETTTETTNIEKDNINNDDSRPKGRNNNHKKLTDEEFKEFVQKAIKESQEFKTLKPYFENHPNLTDIFVRLYNSFIDYWLDDFNSFRSKKTFSIKGRLRKFINNNKEIEEALRSVGDLEK